jgi:hypothetical protein
MKVYEIPFSKLISYYIPFNGFIISDNNKYIYKKLNLINTGEIYNTYVLDQNVINILDDLSKLEINIIILINNTPLDYFVFKNEIESNTINIIPQNLGTNVIPLFKNRYSIINIPKIFENSDITNISLKNRNLIFQLEKNNINIIRKYLEEKKIFPIEIFISDKNLPSSISKELKENNLNNLIIRTMPDIIILDNEENIRMYEIKRKFKIKDGRIFLNLELVQFLFNYIYTKNKLEVNYVLITPENTVIYFNALELSKYIKKVIIHPIHTKIIYLFNTCLTFCEWFKVDYEIRDFPLNSNISGDPYIILDIPYEKI